MTIPFKPSLLTMASVLALSACISGGGDAPAVKSSETPSNKVAPPPLIRETLLQVLIRQVQHLVKVEMLKLLHPVKTVVRCRPLQGLAVAQEANRRHLPITTIMKVIAQEANRRRLPKTQAAKEVRQLILPIPNLQHRPHYHWKPVSWVKNIFTGKVKSRIWSLMAKPLI